MPSTPVQARPKISFPEDQAFKELFGVSTDAIATSAAASKDFVKKLLVFSVSAVTYLRAVLPEDAFQDRYMGDLHLKIIRNGKDALPLAKGIVERIQACFDAIEKRYLKYVYLWFHEDIENTDEVLEAYVFKFTYSSNQADISLSRNDKLVTHMQSGSSIKEATVSLLKTMLVTVEKLEPLPVKVYMQFQLSYTKGTPNDYEPPGFRRATKKIAMPDTSLNLGSTSTNHHSLNIRLNKSWEGFCGPSSPSAGNNTMYGLDLDPDEEEEGRQQRPSASVSAETQLDVRCICGGSQDGEMISCRSCDKWQHAICYGVFPEHAETATEHVCVVCAADEKVDGTCYDKSLLRFSASARQQKALFRRALLAVSESEVTDLTIAAMCRRLNIEEPAAQKVLNKMLAVKLIQRVGGGGGSELAFSIQRNNVIRFLKDASERMRLMMENSMKEKLPRARAEKRKASEACEA